MTPVICTIIAKNYLAAARVLCKSFIDHSPGGRCYVLVIDENVNRIHAPEENFVLVTLRDIPLPEPLEVFCFKYNVTELATAVKPFLLSWLLTIRSEESVLYLDPDILVTASLAPLFERLAHGGGLLLTPHLDQDFPDDGLLPNTRHILTSGVFNLGFLGVQNVPSTLRFLRWLEGKLTDGCVIDHAAGIFVDQKYFDLAAVLFPEFEIERNAGYNVAYWNLHTRTLGRDEHGGWNCNGETLRFFHFSNYKPEAPENISGHQNRFKLSDRQDLVPLFSFYREELARCGYGEARKWPYGYATFSDGYRISDAVRRYFREHPITRIENGPDPFKSKRLSRYARFLDKRLAVGEMWRSQKYRFVHGLGDLARKLILGHKIPRGSA